MIGNTESRADLYGILAEFTLPSHLLEAVRRTREAGYRDIDAFSPFPIEGISEAIGFKPTKVPLFALGGGVFGGVSGLLLQWYGNAISYPINVGGRPLDAWPAFVIPAFEMAVLFAVVGAVFGMLFENRLPRLNYPVFNADRFTTATNDRFFLAIHASDPRFDRRDLRTFLERLEPRPVMVEEVPL